MQEGDSRLNIIDYELSIYIGVSAQEKKVQQKILVSVEIDFQNSPKAIITDNINDTLCYHNICNKLKSFNNKVFSTIEYLCNQIYELLNKMIKLDNFKLEVIKFPAIENLRGGVKFTISNNKK